jgi:KipI family sensor histidine kinase inhibitor
VSGPVRVLPVGPAALLAEVGSTAEALALYAAARAAGAAATGPVTDLVPAARTVLFDGVTDPGRLRRWLAEVQLDPRGPEEGPLVEVPTTYDGPDLPEVAGHWGMTPAEVVAAHTAADLVVAFCGFAPGFAYLTGLPEHLAVPRRATPRSRVPAGSVALAGPFTGVYPTDSPGGWLLVGRTDLRLWDAAAEPPALLVPGTRVRFVAVGPP